MHTQRVDFGTRSNSENGHAVVRQFLISLTATAGFVAIVLVSAGRLSVWQAWVYAALSLALNVGQRIVLLGNPELAGERAKPRPDSQPEDKALLGIGLLLTLAMLVTAGLQFRYVGGPSLAIAWFVAGLLLSVAGALLFLWALRENRFFSAAVRVQRDRRQRVCTTGPYRMVRHPGNLGVIIGTLGVPLLFQSTWSIIPAGLSVLALFVRTHLEDAVLTKELEGYSDYRRQTKYRLLPGLW
ncbi:MAG TPA: isoprenylcysteine carboxylmethyltransferase family protein [Polyangiales bacterium]|nr:isoprenylcysteine carboxylmethyltransferase family protein [Polyangiales bacterium]